LLVAPAGAARPVKKARYVGEDIGVASAAIQVSATGRSLSARRGGSYVETTDCRVRFASKRGRPVRIRRNGKFSLRRRGKRALRLRGRFRSRNTVAIDVRARCKSGTVEESMLLYRKFKPRFRGCRSTKARTLASGATGRIFQQSRIVGFSYVPFAYGCLFSVNKRFELGQDDDEATVGETDLGPFRVAGNYAGFGEQDTQVQVEFACASRVREVDLRDGKDVRRIELAAFPGDCRSVSDLELKSNASIGWTLDGNSPEVWAYDASGKRMLDKGAGVDKDSLTLSGSTLSWMNAGVRRTATLN
jgi:hypothetical protein